VTIGPDPRRDEKLCVRDGLAAWLRAGGSWWIAVCLARTACSRRPATCRNPIPCSGISKETSNVP